MPSEFDNPPAIDALLAKANHPLLAVIQAVRRSILKADNEITEGVKWNSPSFHCGGWFATIRAFRPDRIEVIFHLGAKRQDSSTIGEVISAPDGFLRWPTPDRAIATLSKNQDPASYLPAIRGIAREWCRYQRKSESA